MIRNFLCLLFAAAMPSWTVLTTGLDSNLRGVSVVVTEGRKLRTTIWATGSKGVILHSADSGLHWERLSIPAGETLDLRGVQAFGESTAYVMASGEGEKSGIYKTQDGGQSWTKQYSDARKDFFLDAIACVGATECFALSDPVDGKFLVLHTEDGLHWKELDGQAMPAALPKEGAFAASNTCLVIYGSSDIYFGTGGPAARVFHSADKGKSWRVVETPVASGKAPEGIFSLARRGDTVVALGGDYERMDGAERVAAYSVDQGKSWKLAASGPPGYRSAVAATESGFIAAGPTGAELSPDGIAWLPAEESKLNAIVSVGGEVWGAGPKGTVAQLGHLNH